MTNPPTVVLLGGSGLGPWAWERVTPILNAHGLRALTPQLRATGDDVTPAAEVSLVDGIGDVSDFLATTDQQDITLVAHSFAGYVAAGVLASEADRIRTVVFLDAIGPDVERSISGLTENAAIVGPLNPVTTRLAYIRCLCTTPPAADINASTPGWIFRTLDTGHWTLDTGHWPMITHPDATAHVIEELASP